MGVLPGLNPFEQNLLKVMDFYGFRGARIAVGVSGGADSMALARALGQVAPRRQLELVLVHMIHGEMTSHRQEALACVEQELQDQVLVVIRPSGKVRLQSEAEMRAFRHRALEQISSDMHCDFMALAHHAQDLLETRVMRLLRGTGPQGLRAMKDWDERSRIFRPLLQQNHSELVAYLESRDVKWVEDPTNDDTRFLRNFLRQRWLPEIEAQHPGALKGLARSLGQLAESVDDQSEELPPTFDRRGFQLLSSESQRAQLAKYLRQYDVKEYTSGQIDEVIKRLKSNRRHYGFTVAKRHWSVQPTRFGLDSSADLRP